MLKFHCGDLLLPCFGFFQSWLDFFKAVVNETVFLISFSCLSLVYKKATAFYMLILFPAMLLGVFISCKSFLAESLEILCIESYYLQIGMFFTSFFPIYFPFILSLSLRHQAFY